MAPKMISSRTGKTMTSSTEAEPRSQVVRRRLRRPGSRVAMAASDATEAAVDGDGDGGDDGHGEQNQACGDDDLLEGDRSSFAIGLELGEAVAGVAGEGEGQQVEGGSESKHRGNLPVDGSGDTYRQGPAAAHCVTGGGLRTWLWVGS